MKRATKRLEEQVRGFETASGAEERFRFPAHEDISEISCQIESPQWIEHDQPGDFDGPDVRIS